MKRGIAAGGSVMLGSALVAAVLALFGVVRFGGTQYIETDDFVQVPSWGLWVYIALPIAFGLITFFSTWEDKLDEDDKDRKRNRR